MKSILKSVPRQLARFLPIWKFVVIFLLIALLAAACDTPTPGINGNGSDNGQNNGSNNNTNSCNGTNNCNNHAIIILLHDFIP